METVNKGRSESNRMCSNISKSLSAALAVTVAKYSSVARSPTSPVCRSLTLSHSLRDGNGCSIYWVSVDSELRENPLKNVSNKILPKRRGHFVDRCMY